MLSLMSTGLKLLLAVLNSWLFKSSPLSSVIIYPTSCRRLALRSRSIKPLLQVLRLPLERKALSNLKLPLASLSLDLLADECSLKCHFPLY